MATTTHTAPIQIEQINAQFYVTGEPGGFNTIQAAVDFVRTFHFSTGLVIVGQGVSVGDDISAITGGDLGILIWDNRAGNDQHWYWNGTHYVPQDFLQNTGYVAYGVPQTRPGTLQMGFDPNGTSGQGTANIFATGKQDANVPSMQLGIQQQGQAPHILMRGEVVPGVGNYRILMPQGLYLFNFNNEPNLWIGDPYQDGAKGMHVWGKPTENAIDLQGVTVGGAYDQTIRLNHLGGDVGLGPNALVTAAGSVHAVRGKFEEIVRAMNGTNPGAANLWLGDKDLIDGAKGIAITAMPTENAIDLQGMTIIPGGATYNQTLRLQRLGGDVEIGANALVTAAGSVHAVGGKFDGQVRIMNESVPGFYNLWLGDKDVATGSKGMAIVAMPLENAIDLQGVEIDVGATQTIRLQPNGGKVQIGQHLTVEDDGSITGDVIIGNLAATYAAFDECLVAGSPVRTFANTGDSGGMQFPPAGIGVSTGTAWGASINPNTLQGKLTLTTTGTSGAATLAGNTLNVPIYTAPAQVYPGAGIAVSSGSAWGTPIDPATIPRLNTANVFTAKQTVNALFHADVNTLGSVAAPVSGSGLQIGWNIGNGVGETDYINYSGGAGGGHAWYNVAPGTSVTTATPPFMLLDSSAQLSVKGSVKSGGAVTSEGTLTSNTTASTSIDFYNGVSRIVMFGGQSTPTLAPNLQLMSLSADQTDVRELALFTRTGATIQGNLQATGTVYAGQAIRTGTGGVGALTSVGGISWASDTTYIDSFGAGGGRGLFQFRVASANAANLLTALTISATGDAGCVGQVSSGTGLVSGSLAAHPPSSGLRTYSCYKYNVGTWTVNASAGDGGSRGQFMWGGIGPGGGLEFVEYMEFTPAGGFNVKGGISCTGTKAFVIPHPLDDTKDLWHSCLEGPENGVYYRGEVVTSNGIAEVTLPDYFEALTFPEDRSVQLTQVFETGAVLTMLAASRVVGGKFTVQSSAPIATVAWEVKAVRKIGVERLQVAQAKREPAPAPEPIEEAATPKTKEKKRA
jgi:hypothetical protein